MRLRQNVLMMMTTPRTHKNELRKDVLDELKMHDSVMQIDTLILWRRSRSIARNSWTYFQSSMQSMSCALKTCFQRTKLKHLIMEAYVKEL